MNLQDKNNWVEDVLQSMDNVSKAIPRDSLFSRIEQKLGNINKIRPLPVRTVWMAAASILLLVTLNIIMLHQTSASKPKDSIEEIVHDYHLVNDPTGLGI